MNFRLTRFSWRRCAVEIVLTCIGVSAQAAPQADAVFPLKVSGNGRYLVDQKDRPFLVGGDTPWSLIVQPALPDIERYLADRQARGFNSVIVNLIEHKFCSSPPNTRAGLAPVTPRSSLEIAPPPR